MHPAAYEYVGRFATELELDVVEVGSRNVNYTVRPHFPNANYWGVDAQPGPCVDEVCDGATWRPLTPADLVLCVEVFEHTDQWPAIVENIRHMLRPGGRAVFTCAGPGRPKHGVGQDDPLNPGWYRNVTPAELEEAMLNAGYVNVEVEQLRDDTRGTGVAP